MENRSGSEAKTAIIAGSGDFTGREINMPCDLIIAADGGLSSLQQAGLRPDIIIGDFDSLGFVPDAGSFAVFDDTSDDASDEIPGKKQVTATPAVIKLPVEKDDTDMAAACALAWEQGCRTLRIYGGSGNRPDHFLANLQLAAHYSQKGGDVRLVTPAFTVYALTDGQLTLHAEPGTTFSVFSHLDTAEGVSITGGAKYPAEQITLSNTRTLGVSNLMTGSEACISVKKGTLLVFLYHSPDAVD